jgi:hypothetical protein
LLCSVLRLERPGKSLHAAALPVAWRHEAVAAALATDRILHTDRWCAVGAQ